MNNPMELITWPILFIFISSFPLKRRENGNILISPKSELFDWLEMADKSTSNFGPEYELINPVKILVKPGNSITGSTSSSIRRRSVPLNEFPPGSIRPRNVGNGESGNIFLINDQVNLPEHGDNQDVRAIRTRDEVDTEKKDVVHYLEHSFRLMYLLGMSTYNPVKNDDREPTWTASILIGFQKGFFWTVSFVSLAFSCLCLNLSWVIFLTDKGVLQFIYVGSWLFTIVSEVYFIYLFTFRHKRIQETTMTLSALRTQSIDKVGTQKWNCHDPAKLITVLFIASTFACLAHPMGGDGIEGWSPKSLILDSSKTLSVRLFIWHPDDLMNNMTKVKELHQSYGTKLTPLTISMGITEIGMRFWSNMKMDTAQNLGVVVAVLIWLRNRYFSRKVKKFDFKCRIHRNDSEELDASDGLFSEFKHVLQRENRLVNALMGGLLKIIHAYNLMQCANFLMRCLDQEATKTEFVFLLNGLIKVAIIYYFGKKAEAENQVYQQWIRDWAMQSRDPIFLGRTPAILDEMKQEPLGLGRGHFLVGQGFISRLIGFVTSIFMLEVDDDDDEDN